MKAVRESRLEISQEFIALCDELDFKKKINHSFKHHPFLWLGGAAGAGLLTTFLGGKNSGSREASQVSSGATGAGKTLARVGWFAGALEVGKLLYPFLRPVVLEFAKKSFQSTLAKKSRSQ